MTDADTIRKALTRCESEHPTIGVCAREAGHQGAHRFAFREWPNKSRSEGEAMSDVWGDLSLDWLMDNYPEAVPIIDALVAERDRLREFYEAHWAVEQGIADFDLHDEAVTRLHAARAALSPKEDA